MRDNLYTRFNQITKFIKNDASKDNYICNIQYAS